MKAIALVGLTALAVTGLPAQTYRCDWSVAGIAGGEMSDSSYLCGATCGQTAAGQLAGTEFLAHIGFWQAVTDTVGVREQAPPPAEAALVTGMQKPAPNPFRAQLAVRYSLASAGRVRLAVLDPAGRIVKTLVDEAQQPGRHSVRWSGTDNQGRRLAHGVYFCRFDAGATRQTAKLVLER